MNVASRVANGLSIVAGGGNRAAYSSFPGLPGEVSRRRRDGGAPPPLRSAGGPPPLDIEGRKWRLPEPPSPTLAELFAAHPRDAGWAGFLLPQVDRGRPLLWIQERMAILETGRVHPPGLPVRDIIHVEARDARSALWAMEEGLRCSVLSAVIGELWGDPSALDFTATRRLAVAAERSGVAAFLIRLGGHANLSGARMRWRIASAPSLAHPFDPKAPGAAAWEAELFRARGHPPGRWSLAHDSGGWNRLSEAGDRALDEDGGQRLRA